MSVNKMILLGNLGADPEAKTTDSGTPLTTMRIATSERYTRKDGERVDETEWTTCVLWGRLAEIAAQYLTKGRQVYLEGRKKTRSWEDPKTGETKYKVECVVQVLKFVGSRGDDERHEPTIAGTGSGFNRAPAQDAPHQQRRRKRQRAPEPTGRLPGGDEWRDDDIPF